MDYQYEWLLALVQEWRKVSSEEEDDDSLPGLATVDGVSGQLIHVGWIASNEREFEAAWLALMFLVCAKLAVVTVVHLKSCAKSAFPERGHEFGGFPYEDSFLPTMFVVFPLVPHLVQPHSFAELVAFLRN